MSALISKWGACSFSTHSLSTPCVLTAAEHEQEQQKSLPLTSQAAGDEGTDCCSHLCTVPGTSFSLPKIQPAALLL